MRKLPLIAALVSLSCPALAQEQAQPLPESAPAAPAAAAQTPPAKPRKPFEIRAEQLDTLFASLRRPGADSSAIEQKIWALWSASDSPTAELLLGQAQQALEDGAPAEALSILDRLIGAYPDFAEAWNKRALLFYLMKRDADALKDIGHVLDLEPRHFAALAGKGMILQRAKNYSAARAAFEEALAVNPTLEQVKAALKDLDRLEQGI